MNDDTEALALYRSGREGNLYNGNNEAQDNGDSVVHQLELNNVVRSYKVRENGKRTSRTILHNINLHIDSGEILCLVGPNGAGKTTTCKIAGTLLTPDSGDVRIAGIDAVRDPLRARSHMSLLLGGESGFYRSVSAIDNLRYFADLAGVSYKDREARIAQALDRVGLSEVSKDKVQTFSRGMWQRLHIARAMVAQSDVLLLDEPTTGLDPENSRNVRSLVQELRSQGVAILLTTHEMSEAEKLADSVAIINDGEIIARGSVSQLAQSQNIDHVSAYSYEGEELPDEMIDQIRALDGVMWCEAFESHGVWNVTVMWNTPYEVQEKLALPQGLHMLGNRSASLEETYLAILENVHATSGTQNIDELSEVEASNE
ncbi:ABC transporter ATP-binding protein [Alloscardovia theropitheci]|uniref:ABC transporter ATP-binding protein n=1 Tax=Alloscardovia theropitheci TaxID=2496842 RepID=A0A4R0QS33_9BIFI|nr:ABC transporter ATP-binding protein [Alloscardovia theropitheci]TCD53905.1 ABC transporter ATP-binding protein [Alloscardovia theropitheci]